MHKIFLSIWPYRGIRIILALIFLWAGAVKILDPDSFAIILEAFDLLPYTWVMPVAVGLPILEILAAIGLLFDVRGSLTAVAGLLILFLAVLGYGVWLGLDIDCGCFAPGDPEGEAYKGLRPALYRDLVMLACVAYLYVWRFWRFSGRSDGIQNNP
jgi:uncharacterized membrane protein YphA (DoxX/SURF4 family)